MIKDMTVKLKKSPTKIHNYFFSKALLDDIKIWPHIRFGIFKCHIDSLSAY